MECELPNPPASRKEYATPLKFSKTLASLQLILIHLAFISKIMNLMRKNGERVNQSPRKAQKIQKAQKETGDVLLITMSPFVLLSLCVFCG
jgi:hypothetical protein